MTYCLEAAIEYCNRGFSVIPIDWKLTHPIGEGKNRKKPLVQWVKWQGRIADEAQIRMWWKVWPDAGVGIITGNTSGILVMDADTYKGGTTDGMPPTGMISNTGGGGQHYIYKMVPGARNNASNITHIDVRAEGGYIVAPPSLHESGNAYVWDPDEEPGEIDLETIAKLSPKPKAPAPVNGAAQSSGPLFSGDHWLTDMARNGLQEGSRNDSITRLSGYMAGKGKGYDEVLAKCNEVNVGSPNPLDPREVERTVRSICGKEARKREDALKQDIKSGAVEAPVDDEEIELTGFDAYALKHGGKEVQWLIPGFLTDSTIGFIYGPPQSYKSWIELDMAVSIAQGTPFLGIVKPARTGPVIIFQQEDSHITTSERIATIWAGRVGLKKPKLDDGKFTWSCHKEASNILIYEHRDFRLDAPGAMAKLDRMLAKYKPAAVFMDPFYSLVSLENNMEAAAPLMIELKKLRDKHSCAFMMVHHTSKSSRGSSNRDGLHGSQFLSASNESSLALHNIEGMSRSGVIQPRSKDGEARKPIRVDYDIFDGMSDEPGEWRFNTRVSSLDEKGMRELISPDRKIEDDEHLIVPPNIMPQIDIQTQLTPEEQRRENAVFEMIEKASIGVYQVNLMPGPIRAEFDRLCASGSIKFSEEKKVYEKVLTLRVAGAI